MYSDGSPAKSNKIDTRAITSEVITYRSLFLPFLIGSWKCVILACMQEPIFLSISLLILRTVKLIIPFKNLELSCFKLYMHVYLYCFYFESGILRASMKIQSSLWELKQTSKFGVLCIMARHDWYFTGRKVLETLGYFFFLAWRLTFNWYLNLLRHFIYYLC